MRRNFLFLVIIAAVAAAADSPTVPAELTLAKALDIALANSTALREAQARLDQASGRYVQARSTLMPQVDIGLRQNYQTVNLIGIGIPIPSEVGKVGPFGSMDARIFISQDLLNFANRRSRESFRSKEDTSRLLVDNARELVSLDVVSTYLQALRAKASRDTLAAQTKLAAELYQLTRDRVNQGAAAELDANRAMQQVNALEQQRQEAEQNFIAAKLTLANIMKAQITSEFDVADTSAYGEALPPDRDTAVKLALSARADYRAAESNVKAAELQVRSVKATRLPSVTATFDDGQSGNSPVHNMNTYKVQGAVNFPVFTGGRTRGEIDEAQAALRQARIILDQDRSQVEADVLTAISGVEWALKELDTSAGNVKLSRQEVEFARARFAQGVTDNTEVVNAQDRLARADDANIRARYLLGVARANLARATGAAEKTYHK